jgi:hypothetical protein
MEPTKATIAEIEEALAEAERIEMQLVPRRRRFVRSLHDLGLLGIVGRDWVSVEHGRVSFGDLTPEAFRELVIRLENITPGAITHRPRRAIDELAEQHEADQLAVAERYEQLGFDFNSAPISEVGR